MIKQIKILTGRRYTLKGTNNWKRFK